VLLCTLPSFCQLLIYLIMCVHVALSLSHLSVCECVRACVCMRVCASDYLLQVRRHSGIECRRRLLMEDRQVFFVHVPHLSVRPQLKASMWYIGRTGILLGGPHNGLVHPRLCSIVAHSCTTSEDNHLKEYA